MVLIMHIPLFGKHDEIIWGETNDGKYYVALGYEAMKNVDRTLVWAKAWFPGPTPKINIFLWIMLQNHILMVDNLTKRG